MIGGCIAQGVIFYLEVQRSNNTSSSKIIVIQVERGMRTSVQKKSIGSFALELWKSWDYACAKQLHLLKREPRLEYSLSGALGPALSVWCPVSATWFIRLLSAARNMIATCLELLPVPWWPGCYCRGITGPSKTYWLWNWLTKEKQVAVFLEVQKTRDENLNVNQTRCVTSFVQNTSGISMQTR